MESHCRVLLCNAVKGWPRNGEITRDGNELLATLAPLVDSGRMIEARTAAACAAIAAAAGVQRCVTEDGQVYFAARPDFCRDVSLYKRVCTARVFMACAIPIPWQVNGATASFGGLDWQDTAARGANHAVSLAVALGGANVMAGATLRTLDAGAWAGVSKRRPDRPCRDPRCAAVALRRGCVGGRFEAQAG